MHGLRSWTVSLPPMASGPSSLQKSHCLSQGQLGSTRRGTSMGQHTKSQSQTPPLSFSWPTTFQSRTPAPVSADFTTSLGLTSQQCP